MHVDDFGAIGDGVTNDAPKIQAAIDALPVTGGCVELGPKVYKITSGLVVNDKRVWLRGQGSGHTAGGAATGTQILAAAGVQALTITGGTNLRGRRCRIEGIHFKGSDSVAGANDGIRIQGHQTYILDCEVEGFAGNGIHILSSTGASDPTINANECRIDNVRLLFNFTDGLKVLGVDSNACTFTAIDASGNMGWGIHENSSIGNSYFGVHLNANVAGGIRFGSSTRSNHMFGIYFEDENKTMLQIDAGGAGGHFVVFRQGFRPDGADPVVNNIVDQFSLPSYIFYKRGTQSPGWRKSVFLGGTATTAPRVFFDEGIPKLQGSALHIERDSPAQITADQNNYDPSQAGFWRLSSNAARNITGLGLSGSNLDARNGRRIIIFNVGAFNITLKHQSASSDGNNRFLNVSGADIVLAANEGAETIYDSATGRWRTWKL